MSVSYCGWLHRTVAFMDSLKQIVWCRGFCTFFLFPAFHRQKLRHFDTSKPLPMMDGDRTWHPCEVAVRVSRCEPDKRNHQRICKGNIIQTDQDWFRRIQVLLLRQSEETSWTDRERQWSKMIGVCSCQLLKRSCCAMSLNEKPPHPPCCAKDDTPALAGDEQYKEWKDSLSVRTQVHERCAN